MPPSVGDMDPLSTEANKRGIHVSMPKIPSESRPGKNPARPSAPEQFVSYESDLRFIKKGGRLYIVEVTTKISELKRTHNNVIDFPATRAKAIIRSEADKAGY